MEFAKSYDLPVIDHCEDLNLSAGGDMHEGAKSVRLGLRGIPAAAEDVMVARDLVLAQLTGARYHVAHISTRYAVAMVEYARQHGLPVSCETTPHHFALTDGDMATYDSNYKMKPPLRCLLRPRCGYRRNRERNDWDNCYRPCAASRQREDAGIRELSVRDYWAGNGRCSDA